MPGSDVALSSEPYDPTTTPGFDESWGCALSSISPFFYAYLGIALALGLSVLGAAWGEQIYLSTLCIHITSFFL